MKPKFTDLGINYNKILFGKVEAFHFLGDINEVSFDKYLDLILLAYHPDSPMYSAFLRNKDWDIIVNTSSHKNVPFIKGFKDNKYFKQAIDVFHELMKSDDITYMIFLLEQEMFNIRLLFLEYNYEKKEVNGKITEQEFKISERSALQDLLLKTMANIELLSERKSMRKGKNSKDGGEYEIADDIHF